MRGEQYVEPGLGVNGDFLPPGSVPLVPLSPIDLALTWTTVGGILRPVCLEWQDGTSSLPFFKGPGALAGEGP